MTSGTTTSRAMSPREADNRRLLRARDAIDRDYAEPLDIPTLARIAHVSESHFIRRFKATFGETPHRHLQRRRIERAMSLLRDPFGNHIRITQPATGPVEVTDDDIARWQDGAEQNA